MIKLLQFDNVKALTSFTYITKSSSIMQDSNMVNLYSAYVPIEIPENSRLIIGAEEYDENLPSYVQLRFHGKGGD